MNSICSIVGMNVRVIDPFTIKPLDADTIVSSARATAGKVLTVEDHYREGEPQCWGAELVLLCSFSCVLSSGGLGEAVRFAVAGEPGITVQCLAVTEVPRSGKPQELLDLYGIGAKAIVAAVRMTFAN